MTLPNLLLIGAMKSGTTGLYLDLATHPEVFLAQDKEPRCLCGDEVLTDAGKRDYAEQYTSASEGQIVCDASTDYAKRPDFNGVVERAMQVLPEGFKVIYLVRHPIDRIISQHRHEHSAGLVSESQNNEVRQHSRFIDYSSYAYQLQPWLEAIGSERIMVVRFEDYAARRQEVVDGVCEFLGLEPNACHIELETIYNQSEGKPVLKGFWRSISESSFYKKAFRKLLTPNLRLAIRRWILPSAPEQPSRSTDSTMSWLHESLVDDVNKLSEMLGYDQPLWEDFANVEPLAVPLTPRPHVTLPSEAHSEVSTEAAVR